MCNLLNSRANMRKKKFYLFNSQILKFINLVHNRHKRFFFYQGKRLKQKKSRVCKVKHECPNIIDLEKKKQLEIRNKKISYLIDDSILISHSDSNSCQNSSKNIDCFEFVPDYFLEFISECKRKKKIKDEKFVTKSMERYIRNRIDLEKQKEFKIKKNCLKNKCLSQSTAENKGQTKQIKKKRCSSLEESFTIRSSMNFTEESIITENILLSANKIQNEQFTTPEKKKNKKNQKVKKKKKLIRLKDKSNLKKKIKNEAKSKVKQEFPKPKINFEKSKIEIKQEDIKTILESKESIISEFNKDSNFPSKEIKKKSPDYKKQNKKNKKITKKEKTKQIKRSDRCLFRINADKKNILSKSKSIFYTEYKTINDALESKGFFSKKHIFLSNLIFKISEKLKSILKNQADQIEFQFNTSDLNFKLAGQRNLLKLSRFQYIGTRIIDIKENGRFFYSAYEDFIVVSFLIENFPKTKQERTLKIQLLSDYLKKTCKSIKERSKKLNIIYKKKMYRDWLKGFVKDCILEYSQFINIKYKTNSIGSLDDKHWGIIRFSMVIDLYLLNLYHKNKMSTFCDDLTTCLELINLSHQKIISEKKIKIKKQLKSIVQKYNKESNQKNFKLKYFKNEKIIRQKKWVNTMYEKIKQVNELIEFKKLKKKEKRNYNKNKLYLQKESKEPNLIKRKYKEVFTYPSSQEMNDHGSFSYIKGEFLSSPYSTCKGMPINKLDDSMAPTVQYCNDYLPTKISSFSHESTIKQFDSKLELPLILKGKEFLKNNGLENHIDLFFFSEDELQIIHSNIFARDSCSENFWMHFMISPRSLKEFFYYIDLIYEESYSFLILNCLETVEYSTIHEKINNILGFFKAKFSNLKDETNN